MSIEPTDEMVYAFAGEPEITATDAHAIRHGLTAVLAIVERDRPDPHLVAAALIACLPRLLREAREKRGLSMQAAADELHVAPSTVHRVESRECFSAATASRVLFWLGLDHSASTDQDGGS